MAIAIEPAAADCNDARRLLSELWTEIDVLYGNEAPSRPDLNGMHAPRALFVIARDASELIGCGALRPLSYQTAEVKRLYVIPSYRGRGVARQLMHALEQFARDSGFTEIWLETGLRQPAAIRLYENLGYTRIAGFGDYTDDPLSVCYGKALS